MHHVGHDKKQECAGTQCECLEKTRPELASMFLHQTVCGLHRHCTEKGEERLERAITGLEWLVPLLIILIIYDMV